MMKKKMANICKPLAKEKKILRQTIPVREKIQKF